MPRKQYVRYPRIHPVIDPKSGRTHQSFKDDCDINNLVEHWMRTGVAEFTPRLAQYADVSNYPDFHNAANLRAYADQQFALLDPEDQEAYGTPLAYLEALEKASQEVGTDDPLDVTVPTDTNLTESGQEEGENEEETDIKTKKQKVVHSDRSKDT